MKAEIIVTIDRGNKSIIYPGIYPVTMFYWTSEGHIRIAVDVPRENGMKRHRSLELVYDSQDAFDKQVRVVGVDKTKETEQ